MNDKKYKPLLVLLGTAAFAIVIWAIHSAEDFFVPLCLAALLAFAMAPAVRGFRRINCPEWLSVLLAALLVILPLGCVIYFSVSEIRRVVADWPKILAALKVASENFQHSEFAQRWNLQAYFKPDAISEKFGDMAGSGAMIVMGGMLTILSAGTTFLLIIFFAVMMLASRAHLRKSADFAFATYGESGSASLLDAITDLIEAFLLARFGITVVSAVACWITLMAFGIPYSFLLALFYGLMTWVPVIGIVLALVPTLAVTIAVGTSLGALVISHILLVVVWMVQDHILQPKWLGGKLKLNFFATYLALFIGEHLWGAWGMFLSVPLLGVLRIAFSTTTLLKPVAFAMSENEDPAEL